MAMGVCPVSNTSCLPAPEIINVSWYLQALDAVQDVAQTMTLNTVLNMQWRDWRLVSPARRAAARPPPQTGWSQQRS